MNKQDNRLRETMKLVKLVKIDISWIGAELIVR